MPAVRTGKAIGWIYLAALAIVGFGIGHYGEVYYRTKVAKCRPCERAAASTKPIGPGMRIGNP